MKLSPGAIAGIVVACLVVVLAIVLPLALLLPKKSPKPPASLSPPASSPSYAPSASLSPPASSPSYAPPASLSPPASSPSYAPAPAQPPCLASGVQSNNVPKTCPTLQLPVNTSKVNLWLPTFTAIGPDIAETFYAQAATFVSAFNAKYKSASSVQFTGMWVNLANGAESLSSLQTAVQTAKAAGISLGAVLAVGSDPCQPYFSADFDNFNKLNIMYGCAFTQMCFDVQDILGTGEQNAGGVAKWLATYSSYIPAQVSVVVFVGGYGMLTENIYSFIGTTQYPFQVVGTVELYTTGSTVCLPAGSGCQVATTVQDVIENWTSPTGACYLDKADLQVEKALHNQNGSWAALSVEGQGCPGSCLIQMVNKLRKCDAGGSQSFAQFSLDDFVQILQAFAAWAGSTPQTPLNIMIYESAFLPSAWLSSV